MSNYFRAISEDFGNNTENIDCQRCNNKMRILDYENGTKYSEDGKMPCPDCQD